MPTTFPVKDSGEFGLHIVGADESLGEILLLKTVYAIMTEWGASVARVRVNALGDKDSKMRFERELTAYLRKHVTELDPQCRKALGENPLSIYVCPNAICRDLLSDGPHAMSFLSEKSRGHFREVLEYIESLGLPYEVDDLLVGDEREPRVVFALDLEDGDATILGSTGGRYDEYVRRITGRKDGASVSASVFFRKKGLSKTTFSVPPPSKRPKVYFVQLGLRAKLQGLQVVDMLRAAEVPIAQSFDPSSLGPQLQSARDVGVSHLLIMGQREALDGTVIVRSMLNSQQTIVPVLSLPKFLKSLKV
jgi:histidyl-tRNA synthetase